ncbi:MAG: extracellular solute-binding protein, partial [Gemmataceae bacterium]
EANKSVGFVQLLLQEKNRPRCDVFWNNEIIGTLRLQKAGFLQPYDTESARAFPSHARAEDRTWTAFAARARVLLVNRDRVGDGPPPDSLADFANPKWKSQAVMAKPFFGTTATHLACLFQKLGAEKTGGFLKSMLDNGLQIAPGNKQVAEWVREGATPSGQPVAFGITDTDDAIIECRAHAHVSLVFPDQNANGMAPLGSLFIPNSLSIPRGCPNPDAALKLVDFLLSPETEKRLAEGPSAQIPLNPNVKASLPPEVKTPAQVQAMAVDWKTIVDSWEDCQRLAKSLFRAR